LWNHFRGQDLKTLREAYQQYKEGKCKEEEEEYYRNFFSTDEEVDWETTPLIQAAFSKKMRDFFINEVGVPITQRVDKTKGERNSRNTQGKRYWTPQYVGDTMLARIAHSCFPLALQLLKQHAKDIHAVFSSLLKPLFSSYVNLEVGEIKNWNTYFAPSNPKQLLFEWLCSQGDKYVVSILLEYQEKKLDPSLYGEKSPLLWMLENRWLDLFSKALSIAKSLHGEDFTFLPGGMPLSIYMASVIPSNTFSRDIYTILDEYVFPQKRKF
jgi:hypothetical protein